MSTAAAPSPPSQARSILSFFSGNLAATVISLFATLLVTRWTAPEQLGLWNLAVLISTYVSALQLGVFNGLNRQLPYYRGRQDHDKAERMAEVGFGWCLLLTAATAVVIVAAAGYFAARGQWEALKTTLAIGMVLLCSWSLQFLTVCYAANSEFGHLARKTTLVALAGLPLTLIVHAFGYVGLLVRASLIALASSLALFHERPMRVRPAWDRDVFRELARIGFPIWLLGQLGALFMTLDRMVLASSPKELGYYTIAAQFATLAAMVPTAFNAVVYPRMAQHYGSEHRATALWSQALRACAGSAACSIGLAIVCWFTIPWFVEWLLPAYVPGIPAAQWAALTGVAMAFSVFGNIFNVLGRQEIYLICSLAGLATFVSAWLGLTRWLGLPALTSAAQAMLVATCTTATLSMILSGVTCRRHDQQRHGLAATAASS
jgi:O-antigen/teichoic acid export membrane protein